MPLLQLTNASSPKICSGVVLTGGHGRQAAFGRHIHTRAGRQSTNVPQVTKGQRENCVGL